ncbi:MAG TPA: LacI family transcriptional regulator [Clostridiales bacterium]|nr:LacI family transcriptional regulator [Clostridiales bacterium]
MNQLNRKVTLKDIADAAGVSLMTVSKVLNRKGGISGETSRRVLEIAGRLNYRPNQIARSLRSDETRTLGFVVSDSSQLVFAKIIRAAEEAARQEGYSVIVANTDQKAEREKHAVEVLLNKRIDGLILGAPLHTGEEDIHELVRFGTPLVLLMRTSPAAAVDCVINDNVRGGYEIMNCLLENNCTDLYFLTMPPQTQSTRTRLEGNRLALAEHGRGLAEDHIRYCDPFIEEGYKAMTGLLEQGVRGGGVCCGCDTIAIGAIRAIQDRRLSVPGDFYVTGYDDIELADYLSVPLTTMRQPKEDLGREGVRLLLDRIRNPGQPGRQIVLPSTLIRRRSA